MGTVCPRRSLRSHSLHARTSREIVSDILCVGGTFLTNLQLDAQNRWKTLNRQLLGCFSWPCTFATIVLVHSEFLCGCKSCKALLNGLDNALTTRHRKFVLFILNSKIQTQIHDRIVGGSDVSATLASNITLQLSVERAVDDA
jgi:hypothetical protein